MVEMNGKALRDKKLTELKEKIGTLDCQLGLAVIQVGNNEASNVYVKQKGKLATELGYKFVEAIDLLLKDTKYTYKDIEFVASHGQTIWHDPKGNKCENAVPSTLQIGEPSVISYKTGIKTISNFRTMDVAAGGEGAPLVPYTEYMLFKSDSQNIVLQNIGGISNLTYLPKKCSIEEVFSFDTTDEAAVFVKDYIKAGDAVLIKASHGMKFEKIYEGLK